MIKEYKKIFFVFIIMLLTIICMQKPIFSYENDECIIIKKSNYEYLLYYKEVCKSNFKFAFADSNSAKEQELDFINSGKETLEDKALNIAYIDEELYNKYFVNKKEVYIWIKQDDKLLINGQQVKLENAIDKEALTEFNKLGKKIEIKVIQNEQISKKIDEENVKITNGKIVINPKEGKEYYYQLVKVEDKSEYEQLYSLSEELQESWDTYILMSKLNDFMELFDTLVPSDNDTKWIKIQKNEILQPDDAKEGEKYIVWLKEDGKVIYKDVQFLLSTNKVEKEEDKTISKLVKLPVTYDDILLLIVFGILIFAIVMLIIIIRITQRKETKSIKNINKIYNKKIKFNGYNVLLSIIIVESIVFGIKVANKKVEVEKAEIPQISSMETVKNENKAQILSSTNNNELEEYVQTEIIPGEKIIILNWIDSWNERKDISLDNIGINIAKLKVEIETKIEGDNLYKDSLITYTIRIKNIGDIDAKDVDISNLIPEGTKLLDEDGTLMDDEKLHFNVDIDAGKEVEISYTVKVIAEEATITNKAVVDGKDTDTVKNEIKHKYTVENYTENLDGTWNLESTETVEGVSTGDKVEYVKEYTHFTIDDTQGENKDANIPENDNLIVKLYYLRNKYNVGFDTDGGNDLEPLQLKYEETLQDNSNYQIPTKNGYSFNGWELEDGTPFNEETKVEGDLRLKAKWNLNTYTIEYNLNGGVLVNSVDNYTVEGDTTLNNPTREGYTFIGWTGTDLEEKTMNVIIPSGTTGNRTYTANWEANSYNVTFNTKGGNEVPGISVKYGDKIEESYGYIANPSKEGYDFKGWYYDEECTQKVENFNKTQDTTVFAKWEVKTYTITFDTNGGNTINPITVEHGETIENKYQEPTKEGYTFAGWTLQDGTPYQENTQVSSSLSLKAKWEANSYNVTFDTKGGSEVSGISVKYGDTIEGSEGYTGNPSKDGYDFAGWYYDEECTQKVENFNKTQDTRVYAKWEVKNYKVQINSSTPGAKLKVNGIEQTLPYEQNIEKGGSISYEVYADYYNSQTGTISNIIEDKTITVNLTQKNTITTDWIILADNYTSSSKYQPKIIGSQYHVFPSPYDNPSNYNALNNQIGNIDGKVTNISVYGKFTQGTIWLSDINVSYIIGGNSTAIGTYAFSKQSDEKEFTKNINFQNPTKLTTYTATNEMNNNAKYYPYFQIKFDYEKATSILNISLLRIKITYIPR